MEPAPTQDPSAAVALRRGERVFIRHPQALDREEFLRLMKASRDLHRRFAPWPAPGVNADDPRYFAALVEHGHTPENERLFLCQRKDGAITGFVNLNVITRGALHSAYLGYSIGAPFARNGYMTEGLQLVLAHAFETLELHRVEANIQPENTASKALVERAGFRKEGFSPRYLRIGGEWRDHERWALLVDEWPVVP